MSAAVVVVLVVVLVGVIGGGTVALTYLIRAAGRQQQAAYDQDVAQFVAGTQPDPAFVQRQAEIEQNLADADALVARLEDGPPAVTPPPTQPVRPVAAEPPAPDPTI